MFAGPNRHTLYMHGVPLLCECKDCGRKAAAECGAQGNGIARCEQRAAQRAEAAPTAKAKDL